MRIHFLTATCSSRPINCTPSPQHMPLPLRSVWRWLVVFIVSSVTVVITADSTPCSDIQRLLACVGNEFENNKDINNLITPQAIKRRYSELEERIPWIVRAATGLSTDTVAREVSKNCGVNNGLFTREQALDCVLKHQETACPYISTIIDIVKCDLKIPPIPPPSKSRRIGDTLYPGQFMYTGDYLESENGLYKLVLEEESQLGIYNSDDIQHAHSLWRTPTWYKSKEAYCKLNTNGLFSMNAHDSVLWDTRETGADEGEYFMRLQNDGNVILFDGKGGVLWSTNTQQAQLEQQQTTDHSEQQNESIQKEKDEL